MAALVDLDLATDVRLAGVVDPEPTDRGLALHRYPGWARAQHHDIALAFVETMPTGCRIEMVTAATTIELEVQLTMLQMDDDPVVPGAFDLVVDGELVDGTSSTEGTVIHMERRSTAADFEVGGPTTVRFDGLVPAEKHVQVWLPNAAACSLLALRASAPARPPVEDRGTRRWIHYGSSISHCLEADRPTGVWPVVAARAAGVDLQSLAIAGQAQLDPFAAKTIAGLPADLISLKVGINLVNADSMRERTLVPQLHGFLDRIREGHPDVPLVLISPIWCGAHEDAPGPTVTGADGKVASPDRADDLRLGALTLRRIRELEAQVVAQRRAAGDTQLHLLSGLDLFGEADAADLPDGLHPNPAGYRRMGERFLAAAFEGDGPFA